MIDSRTSPLEASDENPCAHRPDDQQGELPIDRWSTATPDILIRDLKTLARFIDVYCQHQHAEGDRAPVQLAGFDLPRILKRTPELCPECSKLLAHAFVKRSHCPMHPKPACKHCPSHCYHPRYREEIRRVMAFSGRKLLMSGRVDYLLHMFF